MRRAMKMVMFLVMFVVFCFLVGFLVERLWNWLMPAVFGLRTISYWQAIGLLVLSKILLGGFHKHGGRGGQWRGRREWKQKMNDRWAQMSVEDRAKFRNGMRGCWGCRCGGEEKPTEQAAQ